MTHGLVRIAATYSRLIPAEQLPEVEFLWEEQEKYEEFVRGQERIWAGQQLSRTEREEAFGLPTEQVETYRKKYLNQQYEREMRKVYETGKDSNLARRIRAEYHYRFEAKELTEHEIEQARNVPMEKLLETRRGYARCPFHNEKTPSLSIKGNLWHCFGCNDGGDSISFIMKSKNLNFKEAIKCLTQI